MLLLWTGAQSAYASDLGDQVTGAYGTHSRHDSWAYFRFTDDTRNFDTTYVPRPEDYASAPFVGYVATPPSGTWGGSNFGCCANTYYIFRTVPRSPKDMVVKLSVNGDDGHSIVVDGELVSGGGFAEPLTYSLRLAAHTPVNVEIALFNAAGPWVVHVQDGSDQGDLASVPHLQLKAPKIERGDLR